MDNGKTVYSPQTQFAGGITNPTKFDKYKSKNWASVSEVLALFNCNSAG